MKKIFEKEIEKLINPIDVGTLHYMQGFYNLLPDFLQKRLLLSSSKKNPYMGFVVEPYSYFLCYELEDVELAKTLMPDNFKLIKTKIFEDDEAKYYGIFGCMNVHTSGFWGMRVEFYTIAEDLNTNLLTWVILDYDSNTIGYIPKKGLTNPTANKALLTTNYKGKVFVDIERNDKSHKLVFESDITKGKISKLDERLWLEGNLSIGYGGDLYEKDPEVFSLRFYPEEVEQGLEIPLESLKLEINSWHTDLLKNAPSKLVCFPYAQHFLSNSPGNNVNIFTKEDLINELNNIDFNDINIFSTKSFKIMTVVVNSLLVAAVTILLIIIVIIKIRG